MLTSTMKLVCCLNIEKPEFMEKTGKNIWGRIFCSSKKTNHDICLSSQINAIQNFKDEGVNRDYNKN